MKKHSPGPWEVRRLPAEEFRVGVPCAIVAPAAFGGIDVIVQDKGILFDGPNAHLIAAAPALLAALTALEEAGFYWWRHNCGGPSCRRCAAVDQARAAIAKAEEKP